MANKKVNLEVEQGTDFSRLLALSDPVGDPIDITGDTYAAQIRTSYSAPTAAAAFTCTIVSAAGGTVQIALTDTQTSALSAPYTYVYDVERTSAAGKVTRLMYGKLKLIVPEVTRS